MSSFNHTSLSTQLVKSSNTREHVPLHDSEILLCVEVYHRNRVNSWVKNLEILVLGQQFLTELRDKMYCLSDEIMKTATKYDPSGYFLIETTVKDYSKPILDWLRESKKTAQEKWECIASGSLLPKEKEFLGSGSGPKMSQFKARSKQKHVFGHYGKGNRYPINEVVLYEEREPIIDGEPGDLRVTSIYTLW
nr:hypothetical protein [Tanacetum cinerariifolium]